MNTHQVFRGYLCPDIKKVGFKKRLLILSMYLEVCPNIRFEMRCISMSNVNVSKLNSLKVLRRCFICTYAASV